MKGRHTLTIIKPTAVSQGNAGKIIEFILDHEFSIKGLKKISMSRQQAESLYQIHSKKDFFSGLVDFMISGPVYAAILEKENAVEEYRTIMGNATPAEAQANTIRNIFGTSTRENAVHGADSDENAVREISIFFAEKE